MFSRSRSTPRDPLDSLGADLGSLPVRVLPAEVAEGDAAGNAEPGRPAIEIVE